MSQTDPAAEGWRPPDFFIAGAPKCATSSLYVFLRGNPRLFMTTPKEPHWYSTDFPALAHVADAAGYRALFAGAAPDALRGEGSVWYLASRVAAENIRRDNPDAKIIVSLRHPVDAAISWYHQLRNGLREDQPSFEQAWALQDRRAAGRDLPPNLREPFELMYRDIYAYAPQLERYFAAFPRGNVLVLFFDDIARDPAAVGRRLLDFLGVAAEGPAPEIGRHNARVEMRYEGLRQFLAAPPPWLRPMVGPVKRALNAVGVQPSKLLMKMAAAPAEAPPAIDAGVLAEMRAAFLPDIERLEAMLGRDLSAWKTAGAAVPAPAAGRRGGRKEAGA